MKLTAVISAQVLSQVLRVRVTGEVTYSLRCI